MIEYGKSHRFAGQSGTKRKTSMKKKATQSVYEARESVVFSDFSDKNRRSHSFKRLLVIFSVILILAVFAALIVHRFFRVEEIVVDGLSYYDYQTLISSADVDKGQIIFTVSESKIRESLKKNLPHVKDVTVEFTLPSSVYITVEEEGADFYFEMQGEYFVINREMKILDRYQSIEALLVDYPRLMTVSIPAVKSAITGQNVQFASAFDSKHTDDVLLALSDWDRYDHVTMIDFSNRFSLKIRYMDRFEVDFGSFSDFPDKLRLLEEMIDYYDEDTKGTLSVRDVQKGIAWIDGAGSDSFGNNE